MTKILVVDDDENILKTVSTALDQAGFQILSAKDGQTGLRKTFDDRPDLIILDIMLPGMDGLETCRRLRELSDVPIILLTARSSEEDIVKGLNAGADDYIVKPFGVKELVARIQTSLRHRGTSSFGKPSFVTLGDLTIDFARHKVSVRDLVVKLAPTEFRLLSVLARRRGEVVPHRTLLMEVWGPEYIDQLDYLHLYIRYLRRKLETDPAVPELIKTERSIGYYIEA